MQQRIEILDIEVKEANGSIPTAGKITNVYTVNLFIHLKAITWFSIISDNICNTLTIAKSLSLFLNPKAHTIMIDLLSMVLFQDHQRQELDW